MKKMYLLLAVLPCLGGLSQSVSWTDTLKYHSECWVSGLVANQHGVTALGLYSRGYSAPDLSEFRSFVEQRDVDGNRKWMNDQISGAEAASNLIQDESGNSYVALWLSGLNNNVPKIEGKEYPAGSYLISINAEGKVRWVSQQQSPHSLPAHLDFRNGAIEVFSARAGGSVKHVYDSNGNLLSSQVDPTLSGAQYDKHGNGYQRYGENGQVYLIKYDPAENEVWRLPITNESRFMTTINGDIYLMVPEPFINCQVHRLDADGTFIWSRQFNGESCFQLWSDGTNLLLAGLYRSTPDSTGQVVNKIDRSTGKTMWQRKLFIPEHSADAITVAKGAVYVAMNNVFEYDAILVKITDAQWQEPAKDVTGLKGNEKESVFSVFPNPGIGAFTISDPDNCEEFSFEVLDAAGRVVTERERCAGNVRIDLSHCAKGVYQVRIQPVNGPAQIKKIIVE